MKPVFKLKQKTRNKRRKDLVQIQEIELVRAGGGFTAAKIEINMKFGLITISNREGARGLVIRPYSSQCVAIDI